MEGRGGREGGEGREGGAACREYRYANLHTLIDICIVNLTERRCPHHGASPVCPSQREGEEVSEEEKQGAEGTMTDES